MTLTEKNASFIRKRNKSFAVVQGFRSREAGLAEGGVLPQGAGTGQTLPTDNGRRLGPGASLHDEVLPHVHTHLALPPDLFFSLRLKDMVEKERLNLSQVCMCGRDHLWCLFCGILFSKMHEPVVGTGEFAVSFQVLLVRGAKGVSAR